jgi:predicted SAM-dependent methyltransferase
LLKELKKLGVDVFALESRSAADWILKNDFVKVVSIPDEQANQWPFSPSTFQLVIYWHVLEHLSDPAESLKQAAMVLEEGGVVCVSIPNVTSYQAQIGLTTWFHLDVPRHLFHFSRKGILQLLEQSGFEIIDIQSGDTIQNLYGWLQSLANLFTPCNINGLYRLIQGGDPLRTASKLSILWQILSGVIWIPLGVLGWVVEEIFKNSGNLTVYARKR